MDKDDLKLLAAILIDYQTVVPLFVAMCTPFKSEEAAMDAYHLAIKVKKARALHDKVLKMIEAVGG